jgi:hypothetical protein
MKRTRFLIAGVVLAVGLLQACTYPTTQVVRGDERPAIAVEGAPLGSILEVDGIDHGDASYWNGKPDRLLVEPGSHNVRIISNGTVLLERTVYVTGTETRVLTLTKN